MDGLQGGQEEARSLASWDPGVALPRARICLPEALGPPRFVSYLPSGGSGVPLDCGNRWCAREEGFWPKVTETPTTAA